MPDADEIQLESNTVERWSSDLIECTSLQGKLTPPVTPSQWMSPSPAAIRLNHPGRPQEFDLIGKTRRSIKKHQLVSPRWRAHLLHTFLHHELQAAELMAWAILAFPDTPLSFRQGLLKICKDELRHLDLYRQHIETLGHQVGDFPVRDWFWQRVQTCESPLQFVALMGLGLEGSNLDHTQRFTQWFREAGDTEGAAIQEQIGNEEVAHVRFAVQWFSEWTEGLDFDRWRESLVKPLTPTMFRGPQIDRQRRLAAGMTEEFLTALESWNSQ